MSDLHEVVEKTEEGASWRGDIRVNIDGEEKELTVRQLFDPEFHRVMSLIDRDELRELREQLPEDEYDEFSDLQEKDELTDEERERFDELESMLENQSVDFFDVISDETLEGIRLCAKLAVEPDEEDLRTAFVDRAEEIEREYNIKVSTPEDVEEAVQDDIDAMIDKSTDFTSFAIGIQALLETIGREEGNSDE